MTTSTVTQIAGLPEWAQPYLTGSDNVNGLLSMAAAYYGGNRDMPLYQGQRLADPTALQQQSWSGAQQMGTDPATQQAAAMAGAAGMNAGQLSYNPYTAQMERVSAPSLTNYQMQGPGNVSSREVYAPSLSNLSMQAAQAYGSPADQLRQYQMGPAQNVSASGMTAAQMQAARTGYRPDLQAYQMGPAERVSSQSFLQPGTSGAYMSPYMQQVVDIQKREAARQSDIQRNVSQAQAVGQGAYGGSRQAIVEAERQRNLGQQMGDIQAQGSQAAYQQAQQQFNAEQQARMAAQQANQQAGLTVGQQNLASRLGVQQLGAQTGLQTALANLTNEQQAAVQNQAAQMQASGMNAQQALQAALANQQAGLTTGQQNLQSALQTQGLGAGISSQYGLANLANLQQANLQNLSAGLQTQGLGAQTGMQAQQYNQQAALQAALANQQMGYNVGNVNLQALLGIQSLGSGQQMQAGLANQQMYQNAQQLAEQSRQYGAGFDIQALQAQMQAAGLLGQAGQQSFNQMMDANKLQNQYGTQQMGYNQQGFDLNYQDFLNQMNYPQQQLTNYANILGQGLRGVGTSTTQTMSPPPSTASQLIGMGTAAYGAYNMFGAPKKEGGVVDYAKGGSVSKTAGLADLLISRMG